MKICICSDLHIDFNEKKLGIAFDEEFITFVKKKKPDCVLIAGDISNTVQVTLNFIDLVQKATGIPIYFIPGNHDVWADGVGESTLAIEELEKHPSCLIHHSIELSNNVVIVGDSGWYDYSFIDEMKLSEEDIKGFKDTNWDGRYTYLKTSDKEYLKECLNRIEDKLKQYESKQVILVNHFIPREEFLIWKSDRFWNLCNAYMGSKKIGELIKRYENVSHCIFGHTHKRFGSVKKDNCMYICTPLGYYGIEFFDQDLQVCLEESCVILEV
ncbi:metallophosphoesterase [Bacillus sp. JJ664]